MSDLAEKTSERRRSIWILTPVWLVVVLAGSWALLRFNFEPGAKGIIPKMWPDGTGLPRPHAPTLVLAMHPRCSCTRATLGELQILLARAKDQVVADILMYRPASGGGEWSDSDIASLARQISGTTIVDDPGGAKAARFGALTSGQVLLYSDSGTLQFEGGITASRGHSGDNNGRDAVIALLHNTPTAISSTPVFGCSLQGSSSPSREAQ